MPAASAGAGSALAGRAGRGRSPEPSGRSGEPGEPGNGGAARRTAPGDGPEDRGRGRAGVATSRCGRDRGLFARRVPRRAGLARQGGERHSRRAIEGDDANRAHGRQVDPRQDRHAARHPRRAGAFPSLGRVSYHPDRPAPRGARAGSAALRARGFPTRRHRNFRVGNAGRNQGRVLPRGERQDTWRPGGGPSTGGNSRLPAPHRPRGVPGSTPPLRCGYGRCGPPNDRVHLPRGLCVRLAFAGEHRSRLSVADPEPRPRRRRTSPPAHLRLRRRSAPRRSAPSPSAGHAAAGG